MSKLWNYLTGKKAQEPPQQPPIYMAPRVSEPAVDLRSVVQLRKKLDRIPNYRHTFTSETDIDHYKLFSLFHHFPELKVVWESITQDFIENKSLVKPSYDSVCHHRLNERIGLFRDLYDGLKELSKISNMVPYSLVHLLLVTLQDIINLSKASTVWKYPDPFSLHDSHEEIRKLSSDLLPLLGLIEYFISMDESALLLNSDFLSLYLSYEQFLTEKLNAVAGHQGEVVGEFVKLYYYTVHCGFALGKLHKVHVAVNEESEVLLEKILLCLIEAGSTCYKSPPLKLLTQAKYPFLSDPESHLFSRFSLGDREQYDLTLTILKYLTKLSKGIQSVSRLVLPFFMGTVLEESAVELAAIEGVVGIEHRDLKQVLIVMDLLQSISKTDPGDVLSFVVLHKSSIQALLRIVVWSSFDWEVKQSSHHTYHTKATVLEQLYNKLGAISLASLAGTEHETTPISFFEQLLSEEMEARALGKLPLPQVYTLEFISCYISMLSKSEESYTRIINSDLLRIMFAPLFFVMPEEGENQARLSQVAAAYLNDIYKVVLSQDEGKHLVIKKTILSLHMYKLSPAYLNQVTSLLFFLVSERDAKITHYFSICQIADNIYQIIQELRKNRQLHKPSLDSLELMLIKILEMPQISAGVITNEAFLSKFMNEQLFSADTSEFCIQCLSNLMRLSNSEYLYRQYVVMLSTARDDVMFKWLIQGVERTVKGTNKTEMCQKEFMDAELFDVLFKKLDIKGTLSMCSLVLPTLRVILEGNFLCKSQFTRIYLSRLQQVLTRVLKQDQMEALELVLDNLLYILFESDDLSKPRHSLMYPEIAPLILSLLQHFPDVRVPLSYISTFAHLAEETPENRIILAHHGCIPPLLSLLSVIADAKFRTDVLNLIAFLCTNYLSPLDLRAILAWIAKDSSAGGLSKEGKNLVGSLAASCRNALEPFFDQKRPLPKAYFSFSSKDAPIQVAAVRGNPFLLPSKGFTVVVWIRPVIDPETMFSNVFTLAERLSTAALNVTASGSLQFMLSDGEKQFFEIVTEREKLLFNRWNLVSLVCSQKYGKKDDFSLYINGNIAENSEIRPSKFPKDMYSTLFIGGNNTGNSFSGQIAPFYLFAAPATDHQISLFYHLGPDYEGFLQSEETCSGRIRVIDDLSGLKSALSLCVSPRYANLKGRLLDGSPNRLPGFESQDAGRAKRPPGLRRPARMFEITGVPRIQANRTPDTLNLYGGPALLLPLLYKVKDKQQVMELISEIFYMTADLFLIPSHMTVKHICKDHLCDFIRMALEELAVKVEVEPALVRCVIRMVDNLEWNKEARHRAFFTLLHSFRFWSRLDWDLQKDVISHTYRILPLIRGDSDPTTLSSALSLLRTYFSTSRPVVDKDQLPVKREFIWTIVNTHIVKQGAMTDQDIDVVIENLLFTYSYSRDDLPDVVRFTRFLLEKATLKLSDYTKEEFNKAVMFLLRKCGQKGLTGLQADLLNAVREFYLSGKGLLAPVSMIQKQIHRVMSFGGENTSGFRFKSESSLFEVLNCMLPKVLSLPVYSALLRILVGGVHMDNLPLAQIKYPQVLDLVTNRLGSSMCAAEVYQQLILLSDQHVELMYKRDAFPAWLLHLFIYPTSPEEPSDNEQSDLLFSLCASLFSKAFLQLRNPGSQLRSFLFTFAARVEQKERRLGVVYRMLGDVLNGLESGLSLVHAANIKKDVYYNLHDFAYLLEDLCDTSPQFPSDPNYPTLIHRLLELCKKLNLSVSSYPSFPVITTNQTLEILAGAPQYSSDSGDCVRLREGGMMRALISLILRGISHSSSELPSLLLSGLTFLLNGGSQTVSLSAFSTANRRAWEVIMQDDSTFRYLSVFASIIPEPTGDLLYSEQFLTLYVFTYCMEAMYERSEKGLDCLVLGAVVRELTKKYNLGQFLNALMERETPDSMREVQEFHRHHPQLFASLVSTNTRLNSVLNRLEAFVLESSDDAIELKNLQAQVRKLSLDLNKAANGGVEGVLNVVLSEEWRERVHSYLVVQTLAKMLTLSKAISRFSLAGEVHFQVLEPHPDLLSRLMTELQQWKSAVFQRIHQKEKAKDRGETLERLYTKQCWRKYLNTLLTPKTGLWSLDTPPSLFETCYLRLVNRFDRENRHFLFQPDASGSSHSEAINRKHLREIEQSSPSFKRKTITSIDPEDPEQREMLKSFPSLRADSDTSGAKEGEEGSVRAESGNAEMLISEIGTEPQSLGEDSRGEEGKAEEGKTEVDEIPEQETVEEQTPVYTYPSGFEQKDASLLLDCERICLKGAIFGKLELTPQFLMFKSSMKELKPVGVYFGSALECSQIAVESELVWDVREIVEVFSRRFHHLHTVIEVFMLSGKGYYFNLFSEAQRTEALHHFTRFTKIKVYFEPKKDFRATSYLKDWQKGTISNFEYLMVLNKFASRSYNDLNQYPVFPWILKDYVSPTLNLSNPDVYRDLSIPIGAIHPDGLRECTRRYALWTDDPIMKPFHFGSHYSSEGIVLHYLLRVEPFASKAIQLQDGTFDVADRLFFSISSAYEGSTKSSGDVKELIPEFFYLPEMFLNMNGYELGKRQTGDIVSNVELPAWARNSYDFIRQHRKALESLFISDNLHNWIDLVFGYKQWGEAAIAANNVFFCFTYEQHVVPLLKSTADTASMEGVIQQIGQFGQTPVQLFDFKHEKRMVLPCISTFFDRIQRGFEGTIEVTPYGSLLDSESDVKVVSVFALRSRFLIVQDNMVLKIVKWRQGSAENNRPEPSRSQGETEQALENANPYSGDFPRSNAAYALVWPYLISGLHWDNSFKLHEFETGKMLLSMTHHLGLVTCVAYNQGVLVSGSLDSTLAVWELRSSKSQKLLIDPSPHLTLLGHSSGLKQCHLSSSQRLVVSLALDATILIHSLYDGAAMHRIDPGVDFSANLLAFSSLSVIACCSREEKAVRVYSCNGKLLGESEKNEAFVNAKQMFFSASGDFVTVMSNTAITTMNAYAMEEQTEIVLEHVPAAITLTLEDQNIVGISHAGSFFRIDAESKRTKLDLRNIYDPQGFKAFNLDI